MFQQINQNNQNIMRNVAIIICLCLEKYLAFDDIKLALFYLFHLLLSLTLKNRF